MSLLLRINSEVLNCDMEIDKLIQLSGTKNLLNGDDLAIYSCNPENLTKTRKIFVNGWPPGYSLSVIPFYYITGNLIEASIMLDVICIILLFISLIKLLNCLNVSPINQMIFFVFTGFTYTPFYHLTSTDLISLTIFQWAFLLVVQYIKNPAKTTKMSLITGALLFFTGFYRYAYYPLMFSIPFAVIIAGIISGQRKFIKFAVISGITAFVLLIVQTISIKIFSGDTTRSLDQSGIFFENLKLFDPFPFKSFFFLDALINKWNETFPQLKTIYLAMAFLISVAVLSDIFRTALNKKNKCNIQKYFIIIGGTVLLVNLFFLLYMSLTQPAQKWDNGPWTYIMATRYYGPSMMFITIAVMASVPSDRLKHGIHKIAYGLFIAAALLMAVVYWANHNYTVYIKKDKQFTFKGENSNSFRICKIIKESIKPGRFIAITSPASKIDYFITAFSKADAVLYDSEKINLLKDGFVSSSRPATLLIAAPSDSTVSKLKKYNPEKIAELNSLNLYKIEIN